MSRVDFKSITSGLGQLPFEASLISAEIFAEQSTVILGCSY